MKVVFERQPLASGVALIHNIVSAATTMPILSNILIDAAGEEVKLSGTDLESFGQVRIKAQVEEGGRVTVNARLLADIVRVLPEGDVSFETDANRLTLLCNRNTYHLTTMPPEDFPDWPSLEPDVTLTLRQADLKRILHNTMFAIPQKDPRKVLRGVLLEVAEGRLTCVATDGRKLGKTVVEPVEIIGEGGDANIQVIIPERILVEVNNSIGEEGEIKLDLAERQVRFTLSNLCYVSNRIEGTYPKYQAVIPESFTKIIRIQKTTLSDSISRAAVVAERKHHSIILKFEAGQIVINAQSFEEGTFEGAVETDYEGEPFRIAFNHQYLQEIFKVTPDAVTEMHLKDPTAPVVFKCESDPDTLYLIMPVRMAELEEPPVESESKA